MKNWHAKMQMNILTWFNIFSIVPNVNSSKVFYIVNVKYFNFQYNVKPHK